MLTPISDYTHSANTKARAVPVEAVRLEDSFWEPRCKINRTVTLAAQLEHCENTGRIDNFRRASGKKDVPFQGLVFNDSDVYKVMEAIAFSLATHPDAELEARLDRVIQEVVDAQCENGYLNTYFMFEREKERWTNLRDQHELYCAGHLIQAAVIHFRATGKRTLLDVAIKLADHIYSVFGPEGREGACGHPEIEMALIELSRTVNDPKYTALARRMIDLRGKTPSVIDGHNQFDHRYMQDHEPYDALYEVTGHAVRMLYLACGATDAVIEKDDGSLVSAIMHQWENFVGRRMYVTGGAGSRYEGEAFGKDYELPNDRAYTETCAAIASVMWNWRLQNYFAEMGEEEQTNQFADLMEHTLYNAVLPGLSLDGEQYFYQNPLADDGTHRRQEWFGCACCPPNIARTLAMLPGYFYSTMPDAVFVHLYATGISTIPLQNGETLTLKQKTDYPWSGEVEIEVLDAPVEKTEASNLYLRIPYWAKGARVFRNEREEIVPDLSHFYLQSPKTGDKIRLSFPMKVRKLTSHPYVTSNRGQIALQRGPIIYCLENADNTVDVRKLVFSPHTEWTPEHRADLLGGVTVLKSEAQVQNLEEWQMQLYGEDPPLFTSETVSVTAIPYYAWANRKPGAMRVWIPVL